MGTHFMEQNRSSSMISLKDVEADKALLRIRSKHPERHAPEELEALRSAIHEEERFVLAARFDQLWSQGYGAVLRWRSTATGRPRLLEHSRTDLRCWMETAERFAGTYGDQFHIAQLLQVATRDNRDLRALNLRYVYLALLSDPRRHIAAGHVGSDGCATGTLNPLLERITEHRLLREHLEPDPGALRSLRSLPLEADERAGALGLYMTYLDLGLLRVATDASVRAGTAHLSRYAGIDTLRTLSDPPGYLAAEVEKLAKRLSSPTGSSAKSAAS